MTKYTLFRLHSSQFLDIKTMHQCFKASENILQFRYESNNPVSSFCLRISMIELRGSERPINLRRAITYYNKILLTNCLILLTYTSLE